MKKPLALYFSLILIFFISLPSKGQCNIKSDYSLPNDIFIYTQSERIFINKDLENGFMLANVQSCILVDKSDYNQVSVSLVVSFAKSGLQPTIVPGQITLNFRDQSSIVFTAERYDNPNLNGTIGERCYFDISVPDAKRILNQPIKNFIITDTRTRQSLVTTPYGGILQEQVQCLIKKKDELY